MSCAPYHLAIAVVITVAAAGCHRCDLVFTRAERRARCVARTRAGLARADIATAWARLVVERRAKRLITRVGVRTCVGDVTAIGQIAAVWQITAVTCVVDHAIGRSIHGGIDARASTRAAGSARATCARTADRAGSAARAAGTPPPPEPPEPPLPAIASSFGNVLGSLQPAVRSSNAAVKARELRRKVHMGSLLYEDLEAGCVRSKPAQGIRHSWRTRRSDVRAAAQ
jgi:hypothetical protein